MTYTTEEQELIEKAAKEYAGIPLGRIINFNERYYNTANCMKYDAINAAFNSNLMQQIIDSRIKQAKIELLEELRIKPYIQVNDYLVKEISKLKQS